jgi:phage replication O-like protein O
MSAAVHQIAHHQRRSPQLENGYTRIATELLEALSAADLTRREFKVALAILRKTYGFRKKADDVSASHMPANHVSEALNALKDKNVIFKRKGRHGHIIGIQKDYSLWPMDDMPKAYLKRKEDAVEEDFSEESSPTVGLGDECETAEILPLPVPQPDCPSPAAGLKTSPTVGHTIDNSIDNSQKIKPLSVPRWEPDAFETFWTAYPNKTGRKVACKHWDALKPASGLVVIILDSIARLKKSRKWRDGFAPQGDTFLSKAGWEDATPDSYSEAESAVLHNYNEMLGAKTGKFVEEEAYSEERAQMARVCLQDLEEIVGHPERGEYSARYFAFILQHCPPKQLPYMTPEWVMRSVAKAVNKDFSR